MDEQTSLLLKMAGDVFGGGRQAIPFSDDLA